MRIDQVHKFEHLNDLTINVYTMNHDGKEVTPLYISKTRDLNPINLLLIQGENKNHYTWIKNFDFLLSYDVKHPKRFCFYCMYGFDKRYDADQK